MFSLGFRNAEKAYEPLDEVELLFHGGELVKVFDGNGRLYVQTNVEGKNSYLFLAGGAIGTQKIELCDAQGTLIDSVEFVLNANTSISDNTGIFDEFTKVLKDTMNCYAPDGLFHFSFKDKTYGFYVPWILDHVHTAKGMQFFSSHERDLVDLFSLEQNTNGMIWSNVFKKTPVNYIDSNYGEKFSRRYGEIVFSRQPVENHCEYNFVNCMYISWKASGDDEWLKGVVDSAVRALNYSVSDNLRWSKKYNLLKRAYCIDSWDFQIEDEFLPDTGVNNTMLIDEKLTKFGVFFGDNTGYASACKELSLMLAHLERKEEADVFEKRSHEIMDSLRA
ncbi:MAG: hypothetical protein WCQ41_08680 [Bacillota bacterium]